jgi:hypothetical protein
MHGIAVQVVENVPVDIAFTLQKYSPFRISIPLSYNKKTWVHGAEARTPPNGSNCEMASSSQFFRSKRSKEKENITLEV